MLRVARLRSWGMCLVLGLSSGWVFAEDPKPAGTSPKADAKSGTGIEAHNRLINQLTKLHDEMKDELDLDSKQKQAIHDLFEQHIKELKASKGRKASDKEEEAKDDELNALRDQVKAAREANDTEKVNALRKQMRDKMRERRVGMMASTVAFLEKVEGELNDDQVEPFQEMVKELGLDGQKDKGGETLQDLMRAVMNPKVGLSDEQSKNIREIMKEAFLSMDQDERAAGDLEGVTMQLRADMMNELTPEQQKIVEDLLKQMPKTPNADPSKGTRPPPRPETPTKKE